MTGSLVVAVDVGGTTMKGALVDDGQVLQRRETPTRAPDGPAVSFGVLETLIESLLEAASPGREVAGIGVAVPGTVDEKAGRVLWAENLDWRDLAVRDRLAARFNLPVGFGHDVRTAALAEWRLGAGRGREELAYLSIGTGIAAALVAEDRLLTGGGWAGEIGHGGVHGGAPCACGGYGCAETYASSAGMVRRYHEVAGAIVTGSDEVLARAERGDPIAREVWDAGVDRLGELVAALVRVLGMPAVVVGGGMANAGEALLNPLRERAASYLTYHPLPEIVAAELGADAGIRGAGLLARRAATS